MELPVPKPQKTSTKPIFVMIISLIILTLFPICLLKSSSNSSSSSSSTLSSILTSSYSYNWVFKPPLLPPKSSYDDQDYHVKENTTRISAPSHEQKECDLSTGEWVPNPDAPYYTDTTCNQIHEHQNCMKFGRPDRDFMRWRWKPDGCDLPVFDPHEFLEIVRGKSMAFVGDSVGRNHMQSLICLLSRVEYPADVSYTEDYNFKRWRYTSYNFTVATLWTTHLIRSLESDKIWPSSTRFFHLYLDEPDESWASQIPEYDYLIISSGQWFFRPLIFHENGDTVGCQYCDFPNVTHMEMYGAYRKAFRKAFATIIERRKFKGTVVLRTFAPSHFENGKWNQGGDCLRTRPFRRNETVLEGENLEVHKIQIEEFQTAEREARKKGLKFRKIDTTPAMLLRPDGHPSRYGHLPGEYAAFPSDCVHWCLPGPIDTWNDFLLQILEKDAYVENP